MNIIQNRFIKGVSLSLLAIPLFLGSFAHATTPDWNVTGTYVIAFNYLGSDFAHDMTLTQDNQGNLSGNGGSPAGANTYTWVVTEGTVQGNTIAFSAKYTATADAVTPQTTLRATGTIASNGTLSGTWSDNYQGSARSGTWTSTSGVAVRLPGTLIAEDFGVVHNVDTGVGILRGYTAGFGLTDATFANAQSVVMKLYSGTRLLQTNSATPKVARDVTGTQISSPFDVSGTFDYVADGYWVNTRERQYGQSVPATKVVATVILANGKVVTAENTSLSGDPSTIFPTTTPPQATTTPTLKSQCKDGGWKTFTNPTFKNQGKCIQFVKNLKKEDKRRLASLEVEADVFRDITVVEVEINDRKTVFTTSADTRREVASEVASRFDVPRARVLAVLDFEIEDRASRPKDVRNGDADDDRRGRDHDEDNDHERGDNSGRGSRNGGHWSHGDRD